MEKGGRVRRHAGFFFKGRKGGGRAGLISAVADTGGVPQPELRLRLTTANHPRRSLSVDRGVVLGNQHSRCCAGTLAWHDTAW